MQLHKSDGLGQNHALTRGFDILLCNAAQSYFGDVFACKSKEKN